MNRKCPRQLGGANVVAYAIVEKNNIHTKNTTQIVSGKVMGAACAMVIAQIDGDSGYYLFGSYSQDWASETDSWHEDLESAIDQLDWEYQGLSKNIVWYMRPDELTQQTGAD